MKITKGLALTTISLISIALLAACGKGTDSSLAGGQKVTTVTVAQTADSKPYAYKADGELTGFDIEVLKAVDKKLANYRFSFKTVTDEAILIDIDAGRSQLGANNFGKTPDREKNIYLRPRFQKMLMRFSQVLKIITHQSRS